MKNFIKLFWIILIPAAVMASPARFKNTRDVVDCDFILSEPRSGINWLRWCLISLTKKPIYGHTFIDKPERKALFGQLDETKDPFVRTHSVEALRKTDPTRNRLILIYRNYKENTIRRCRDRAAQYKKMLDEGKLFDRQAEKLRLYDEWPEENRYLVYYEDLMENPRETLEGALDFLNESDERLGDFLENLDQHKADCLAAYEYVTKKCGLGGPISKGKSVDYHSKKIPKELLLQADALFEAKYPYLWKKYLTRYTTK